MAAAKKGEPAKEEGTTYVRSDGQTFKAPKYNATENQKILENKYVVEGLDDMQTVIFQDDIQITVVDKNKEEDSDLTSALNDMVITNRDVALNFSTQKRWRDVKAWGPALTNPVWDYEGPEYRLMKLNRLPPDSFAKKGKSSTLVYNRLLPGICVNEKTGEIEFWQTQRNGQVSQLTNVHMTIDPLSSELGGTPFIMPIFPYIKMLNYSWQRQMAKVNQWGDGGIWSIKVDQAQGDDVAYAKKLLQNTSSTKRFPLRENMSVVNLGISGDGSALETITEIGSQLRRFFIRSDLGKDGGQLVGGTNTAELRKYISSIRGQQRWIEWDTYMLLKPWLIYNGYEEKGYQIIVKMVSPEIDRSADIIKIATEGKGFSIGENEHRALLSEAGGPRVASILKPLDGAELAALRERNAAANQNAFGAQLQKAEIVTKAAAAGITNKSGARSFLQATLGIEEGEPEEDLGRDQERRALLKLANATEDLAAEKKKERV